MRTLKKFMIASGIGGSRSMLIVAGPIGQNMGFWTDSHVVFESGDCKVIPNHKFESAWSAFEASHPAMADKDG
jgi:hypothetical protein